VSGTFYVLNEDSLNFLVEYFDNGDPAKRKTLQDQWQYFTRYDPGRQQNYKMWLRLSSDAIEVAVDHVLPAEAPAGRYRIETFVPGKHATSQRAAFLIGTGVHPNERGGTDLDDRIAIVDMDELCDVWYSLGEFDLQPSLNPLVGRVRQFAFTREDPQRQVSFGPVRWVPVEASNDTDPRFDSPVGMPEERNGPLPTGRVIFGRYPFWAGEWYDANPFLKWYVYGFHTGADLNLPGTSGADKGKPIYAVSDGVVTYAGRAGSWGSIVVIEHPSALVTLPNGETQRQMVYSRYGHVEREIPVKTGETVQRGQQIGSIGLAAGATMGWHLHFDVSYTNILKKLPAYWPDLTTVRAYNADRDGRGYSSAQTGLMRQVVSHFVDPLRFLKDNHGGGGPK
jgi:murein DD-endopeptidase MepM/ murein hydrolase activator NlpD